MDRTAEPYVCCDDTLLHTHFKSEKTHEMYFHNHRRKQKAHMDTPWAQNPWNPNMMGSHV